MILFISGFLFCALIIIIVLISTSGTSKETKLFTEEQESKIIEIIGNALTNGHNGEVGVYTTLKEIVLWDLALKRADYKQIDKIEGTIKCLLDYLKLEIIEIPATPQSKKIIRKKK